MKRHLRTLLPVIAAGFFLSGASGADWSQWGGSPARNNAPMAGKLPTTWNVGSFQRKTERWLGESAKNMLWVAGEKRPANSRLTGCHSKHESHTTVRTTIPAAEKSAPSTPMRERGRIGVLGGPIVHQNLVSSSSAPSGISSSGSASFLLPLFAGAERFAVSFALTGCLTSRFRCLRSVVVPVA